MIKGKITEIKDSSIIIRGKVWEMKLNKIKDSQGHEQSVQNNMLISKNSYSEIPIIKIKDFYYSKLGVGTTVLVDVTGLIISTLFATEWAGYGIDSDTSDDPPG